ncbi:MAG: ATP-binding protein [Nanoarchaeota archaeon]
MIDTSLLKEVVRDQAGMQPEAPLVEREAMETLVSWHKTPFVVIVSGMRRCGKSTLLFQLRQKHPGYYLNFDDERLLKFTVEDFQPLYELFVELYGNRDIFYFDEIQNVVGWELFVRRLRDSGKKVYVTGSNASMLSQELGTRLTGRYIPLILYPFSFREFLLLDGFTAPELLHTTLGRGQLKKLFNEYLEKGGIPEYVKTGNREYLKTIYENIMYRDVLVRYKITNQKQMRELVQFVASNVGKEVSFNSLKKTLGLGSQTTVKEYFDYLENSFLLFLLPKFAKSLKKQMYANKKAYLIDTGLAVHIGYRLTADLGRLLENLVFLELKRRKEEISFFKEKYECDFILTDTAMQVCYALTAENEKREFEGLIQAMRVTKRKKSLVLTYDQEETRVYEGKHIQILPVWKWLVESTTARPT